MQKPSFLRHAFRALLPATLLLAACSKKDEPVIPPAVDQGQVIFINAASHIAPTTLKFVVDNSEKASLDYGRSSSYQGVQTGSRNLQVTAGSQNAFTQSLALDKDKHYTFVATPAASSSTVGGQLFTDDVTTPPSGKARIRVINLGQSVPGPIRLSQVNGTAGGPIDIVTNVAANSASAFTDFNPGIYNLSIIDNAGASIDVGDGSGGAAGSKKYEDGKIYTVLVSGTKGSLNQDQKLKAFLSGNN